MIKVDVVSGFLGAGKTTLIRKLLKAYEKEKVVLIENEFGEIGIDGDVVERDGFDVFEISSGCICCIMKKDFVLVLDRIIKEYNPERIIVEPTGISILSEIIDVLTQPEFQDKCSINSLLTVVDSLHYLAQRDAFGEFFEDQITNASLLLLSKSQYVDESKIKEIIASVRELNSKAPISTISWDYMTDEDLKELLAGNLSLDIKELLHTEYKPCSENEFDTFALKIPHKFSKQELEEILGQLKNREYGQVLRGKGFLKGNSGYFDFSYTNGTYEVKENNEKTSGKLCLIGKGLNEQALRKLFRVKDGGMFNWLKF